MCEHSEKLVIGIAVRLFNQLATDSPRDNRNGETYCAPVLLNIHIILNHFESLMRLLLTAVVCNTPIEF